MKNKFERLRKEFAGLFTSSGSSILKLFTLSGKKPMGRLWPSMPWLY